MLAYYACMNRKQRAVLAAIFARPAGATLAWVEIEALLTALGCVAIEGSGSRVKFVRNGRILAIHRGTGEGKTLCFSGHLDTVPVGTEAWTHDPFGGVIEGDRLWGRGACDMKGGVAAMVVAFERLHRRGQGGPVTLVLTASEETAGTPACPAATAG